MRAILAAIALATAVHADETATTETPWIDRILRAHEALEWSDVVVRHDWRLQHRPEDDRCRILDPGDHSIREGTPDDCRREFAAMEAAGTIPSIAGPTVIVLHGLGESRDSMKPLAAHLRRTLEATVMLVGYASTAADLEAHGRSLDLVIRSLPSDAPISFVGHSLGNLVVRRWMSLAAGETLARVDRMVMLGPPNQGSALARQIGGVAFLSALAHGAARDLVVDWDRVEPHLAQPACPFGIVAGGRGDDNGFSSMLEGDDDAVVRVEETHLAGAGDFLLVPVHHAGMLRDQRVQRATESFLKTGQFGSTTPEAAP